jgi:phosphoribosyl 1,2-cyclic phosphodiesterase
MHGPKSLLPSGSSHAESHAQACVAFARAVVGVQAQKLVPANPESTLASVQGAALGFTSQSVAKFVEWNRSQADGPSAAPPLAATRRRVAPMKPRVIEPIYQMPRQNGALHGSQPQGGAAWERPARAGRGIPLSCSLVTRGTGLALRGDEAEVNTMHLEFWGVRGSIASPGGNTAAVGGNKSCVEVKCGGTRIVLDAGTGLRALGDTMVAEARRTGSQGMELTLLLSHFHWDHIQGLPFFVPAYMPTTKINVVGGTNGLLSLRDTLAHQMTAPVFPVRLDELSAEIATREVRSGEGFAVGDVIVRVAKLNHPGGVHAYRITHGGRSIVYATDTEHYACVDPALVQLAAGADILIYDAQFTPEEYSGQTGPSKVGWGHSTYAAGAELAKAAGVSQLVLFHHDPRRSDAQVASIEDCGRALFPATVAAREGMRIVLAPASARTDSPMTSASAA